jgi:glycosyltransferase involved in cell wall biosynthesis
MFDGKDLDFPIPGMSDVMPYRSSIFSTLTSQQLAAYQDTFKNFIQEAVRAFQPDILHSHHLWIASSVARDCAPHIPMVTTCHSTCLRQYALCPAIGPTMSRNFRKIDGIMALSAFQKREIIDIHGIAPERIEVVGGGYDGDIFYPGVKTLKGPVEILYAGKLSRSKGVPWLLQALRQLEDLPWTLHLAGDGSGLEKQLCLDLAAQFGSRVVIHGSLDHDRLAHLMRMAHIFILPSFSEGLPLVLIEALASGCRIIATALPGIREILGGNENRMIQLVEIPELETVDAPYDKDLQYLEDLLAASVRRGIAEVIENGEPDLAFVKRMTAGHTWREVFAKIDSLYSRVSSRGKTICDLASENG